MTLLLGACESIVSENHQGRARLYPRNFVPDESYMGQTAFETSVKAFTERCKETIQKYTGMHEVYDSLHASVCQKSQSLTVLRAEHWHDQPSEHLDAISEAIAKDLAIVQDRRDALHEVQTAAEGMRAECKRALTDLLTTFHALNTKLSTGTWLLTYEGPAAADEDIAGIRGVSDDCECAPWKKMPSDTTRGDDNISERVNEALCNNIPSGVTLFADQKHESDIMMTRQQNWKLGEGVMHGHSLQSPAEAVLAAAECPVDNGLSGAPRVPSPVKLSAARCVE